MITITEAQMTESYEDIMTVAAVNAAEQVEKCIKATAGKGVYRFRDESDQIAQKVLTLFEENGFSVDRSRYEIFWGEPKRQFDEIRKNSQKK